MVAKQPGSRITSTNAEHVGRGSIVGDLRQVIWHEQWPRWTDNGPAPGRSEIRRYRKRLRMWSLKERPFAKAVGTRQSLRRHTLKFIAFAAGGLVSQECIELPLVQPMESAQLRLIAIGNGFNSALRAPPRFKVAAMSLFARSQFVPVLIIWVGKACRAHACRVLLYDIVQRWSRQ